MVPEVFAPGIISTGEVELNSAFSPDGNRLYFCSNRKSGTAVGGMDIWFSERTENGWSEAKNIEEMQSDNM